jgi:hypothetical protein
VLPWAEITWSFSPEKKNNMMDQFVIKQMARKAKPIQFNGSASG